jgi:DNA modification methylase
MSRQEVANEVPLDDGLLDREKKEREQRKRTFNGLTAREWTKASRNVWADLSSPRSERHLEHGAVFPVALAERCITLYSGEGDLVLDPFLGIGSTLVAAKRLGRPGVGIELNPRFAKMATDWLTEENSLLVGEHPQEVVCGDSVENLSLLEDSSVQLTVTSPPYADFIRRSVEDRKKTHKKSRIVHRNNSQVKPYSDDPRDLGNLEYQEFIPACKAILTTLLEKTRPEGYAVWVVKDHRLPPEQPYVPVSSDLARAAQEVGWLWHDLIVWDQNEQRSLVLLGYPSRFYTNQNCSFLVVLRRPGT